MFTGRLLSLSAAAIDSPNPKIKAVTLGGWLVTEGWIKPSLFDGISNKDHLDGTQVQFRSVKQNKYIAAENGGGTTIVANRASPSRWETFKAKTESLVTADFQGGTNWGDDDPSVFVMTIVVELINEPLAPGVMLDSLTKYYRAGYNTVRKYTQSAYVIMPNRLGPADPKELFSVASGLSRVVINVHYYNLFTRRDRA
ncbi:hypothetical protein QJS10_CPB18g01230 [Acorus calamus]|uniref:DUF7910 domain-containing protein n=1 Tax=Acorus calamus TaxID=4465 RepID=A0AAV9CS29_ACOCL|nr:hypothetical protein QJS10_CPB18g01230 [Acorus calamus]